jgi:hypothetical protein
MTTKTPARVEVDVRSMVCTAGISSLLDDHEYVIPTGGRGRRGVKVGDHLAADHPLVLANPGAFSPSPEPPDTWPIGVLTEEARVARQQQTVRLDPAWARRMTPVCRRCGHQSKQSVTLTDPPQATDLISALSALDDADLVGRARVEARFAAMARDHQAAAAELAAVEQAFRVEHPQCPEGTAPLPEPDVPASPPMFHRLPSIRTLD